MIDQGPENETERPVRSRRQSRSLTGPGQAPALGLRAGSDGFFIVSQTNLKGEPSCRSFPGCGTKIDPVEAKAVARMTTRANGPHSGRDWKLWKTARSSQPSTRPRHRT